MKEKYGGKGPALCSPVERPLYGYLSFLLYMCLLHSNVFLRLASYSSLERMKAGVGSSSHIYLAQRSRSRSCRIFNDTTTDYTI